MIPASASRANRVSASRRAVMSSTTPATRAPASPPMGNHRLRTQRTAPFGRMTRYSASHARGWSATSAATRGRSSGTMASIHDCGWAYSSSRVRP